MDYEIILKDIDETEQEIKKIINELTCIEGIKETGGMYSKDKICIRLVETNSELW